MGKWRSIQRYDRKVVLRQQEDQDYWFQQVQFFFFFEDTFSESINFEKRRFEMAFKISRLFYLRLSERKNLCKQVAILGTTLSERFWGYLKKLYERS